ncbi:MAG TPA: hypothetical protein VK708_19095, partial [Bryobacteraceae bacterium]|nr:hypothetical protein [Bryobacteraceae bacterium]
MSRKIVLVALALATLLAAQDRGSKLGRIDVDNYAIDADINPHTQTLTANVKIRFMALDNDISSASFELNGAFNVSRVVDDSGHQIPASRSGQDMAVRVNFPAPLAKGKSTTVTFTYDGRLTGQEESPVDGIKFGAIQNDITYLMYPARWFPVNGYTTDRFTSDLHITVPTGYQVIASGLGSSQPAGGKTTFTFRYAKPSFPGSIAVVQGEPVKVNSEGVTTSVYFRQKQSMANAYGEETGKVLSFLTSVYGLAPQANLTLVETEDGTPNGYSAPGIIFLSPRGIGNQVASRLLANQLARQWWETLVSPV